MEGSSSILMHNITPEMFEALLEDLKLEIIEQVSSNLERNAKKNDAGLELMTREQTSKFFKINISTVRNWTRQGILLKYGVGDRVYYKRSEVEAALVPLNQKLK